MCDAQTRRLVLDALALLNPRGKAQPSPLQITIALGCQAEELDQAFVRALGQPASQLLPLLTPEHLASLIAPLSPRPRLELIHSERSEAEELTLLYDYYDSPYGELLLVCSERGLCMSPFTYGDPAGTLERVRRELRPQELRRAQHPWHEGALSSLHNTDPYPELPPLHLLGTPFQRSVWEALTLIPRGSCVHYHTLADYIGRPKATRAVGTAVGDNPLAPFVPCHRVLPTSNTLGGYYWGHALKALLLLSELRPA